MRARLGPDAAVPAEYHRAPRARAGSHRQDGLRRLLPHRRGFHPLGTRERCAGRGRGRGSGAGSLVAWVLRITDLDPIEHQLLFERFLNPERVSMPDFDVDFCMDGRDRVITYVAERYGRERVSQIITYGTMAAKAVVRDVARVLGHPFGVGDRIAKLIPNELDITLAKSDGEGARAGAPRPRGRGNPHPDGAGAEARRHHAQCRQARGWRGDRAVGADRLHAAVQGSRFGRRGHAVRQETTWKPRAS